eukprot:2858780-Ditylum_brightwellii.AAC.1
MDRVLPKLYNQIKSENKIEGYNYPVQVQSSAVRTQSSYTDPPAREKKKAGHSNVNRRIPRLNTRCIGGTGNRNSRGCQNYSRTGTETNKSNNRGRNEKSTRVSEDGIGKSPTHD